jgi:hypothetical protein
MVAQKMIKILVGGGKNGGCQMIMMTWKQLPYPDTKVAGMLCVGGPCSY